MTDIDNDNDGNDNNAFDSFDASFAESTAAAAAAAAATLAAAVASEPLQTAAAAAAAVASALPVLPSGAIDELCWNKQNTAAAQPLSQPFAQFRQSQQSQAQSQSQAQQAPSEQSRYGLSQAKVGSRARDAPSSRRNPPAESAGTRGGAASSGAAVLRPVKRAPVANSYTRTPPKGLRYVLHYRSLYRNQRDVYCIVTTQNTIFRLLLDFFIHSITRASHLVLYPVYSSFSRLVFR